MSKQFGPTLFTPCKAYSQAFSVNSLRWRIWGERTTWPETHWLGGIMRPKDWARARAYLHDGKEMYKRCDACALLLQGNQRSLYLLTQRNHGIIRETQFLLWQKTNTRKLFMMPGPYSNDLRWHTICPVALWDPLRWRNAKHYVVSHPIELNTTVVYLLSFRKIQLESKNTFWVVPAEDFREQRNIWKGSPVFPDGMFQTEIRVDTSFRYIFRAIFR